MMLVPGFGIIIFLVYRDVVVGIAYVISHSPAV